MFSAIFCVNAFITCHLSPPLVAIRNYLPSPTNLPPSIAYQSLSTVAVGCMAHVPRNTSHKVVRSFDQDLKSTITQLACLMVYHTPHMLTLARPKQQTDYPPSPSIYRSSQTTLTKLSPGGKIASIGCFL